MWKFLILVGLSIVSYPIIRVVLSKKLEADRRKGAREVTRLKLERAEAVVYSLETNTLPDLETFVEEYSRLDPEVAGELRYLLELAHGMLVHAKDCLEGDLETLLADPKLTLETAAMIRENAQLAESFVSSATNCTTDIYDITWRIDRDLVAIKDEVRRCRMSLSALRRLEDALYAMGVNIDEWSPDIERLARATLQLDSRPDDIPKLRDAEELVDELEMLGQVLDRTVRNVHALRVGIPSLEVKFPEFDQRAVEATEIVQALEKEYLPESVGATSKNPHKAMDQIGEAKSLLGEAKKFEQAGEWSKGIKMLQEAEYMLRNAKGLLDFVWEHAANMADAKRLTPEVLEKARTEISKALAFCAEHEGDIWAGHARELAAVEESLARVDTELAKEMPNFLEAENTAEKAWLFAMDIHKACRNEHEDTVRDRKVADRAQNEARSDADLYWNEAERNYEAARLATDDANIRLYSEAARESAERAEKEG